MAKMAKTQLAEVLSYLQKHKGITPYQAFEKFGITRLADIIFKLRKAGYEIKSESISRKNRYGNTVTFCRYELE